MSALPVSGNTTTSGSANITIRDANALGPAALSLSSGNGVTTVVSADGAGNLRWGASMDGSVVHHSVVFSKPDLEEKIKQFHAGKYTRRYIEVYLDFMVMNAMLDNLEYLEYKVTLDKELQ